MSHPAWKTYGPYVLLIYFFNAFLLPHGLLYSAILSPVFIYWLWKQGSRLALPIAALLIILLDVYYGYQGASIQALLLSSGLFFTAVVFAITAGYWFDQNPHPHWLFKRILTWNSLFILVALIALPFSIGRSIFWYEVPISPGIPSFPRLKLFTYEASYYALLFAPLFLYFLWRILFNMEKKWLMISFAIFLPLLLSLSFGVIGALGLALLLTLLFHYRLLIKMATVKRTLWYAGTILTVVAVLIWLIFPENPVYLRIESILAGGDTSAKGRLYESFMFAADLVRIHNPLLGVGFGQIKVLAHEQIINYYQYEGDFADIVRIPNSVAELLATFGYVGMLAKLLAEILFFIRYRVFDNAFNLSLFLFIFIYQFTGSFLVNTAEIIIWCMVFFTRFEVFSLRPKPTTAS